MVLKSCNMSNPIISGHCNDITNPDLRCEFRSSCIIGLVLAANRLTILQSIQVQFKKEVVSFEGGFQIKESAGSRESFYLCGELIVQY